MRKCPFCGSKSIKIVKNIFKNTRGERYNYYVRCNRCLARAGKASSEEFAIKKWDGTYWLKEIDENNLFDR